MGLAMALAACGPQHGPSGSNNDGTGATTPAEATSSDTASTSSTDGSLDDDSGSTSASFVPEPDMGIGADDCNQFTQDCPPGEKCMPWDDSGGTAWNATRCVTIADDPGAPGDPCTVEGVGNSGIDDCELGTMCWDVDPFTLTGVCAPLCSGSVDSPACEDPNRYCWISADAAVVLCLPLCHPLAGDCPAEQGCYANTPGWRCAPSSSSGEGVYGASCEFIDECEPGLVCIQASTVPGCGDSGGCCSEPCDLDAPDCPHAGEGVTCVPWYDPGTAPPGFENVGVCALPP
ncbi:MAG: hypothetical protein AAF799_41740 [Myxococcota bacterium]